MRVLHTNSRAVIITGLLKLSNLMISCYFEESDLNLKEFEREGYVKHYRTGKA